MPGFALHYLFGTKVFRTLPKSSLRDAIRKHPKAYGLGLQGPDLFFYDIPTYIGKANIGSVMHKEHADELFRQMAAYQKKVTNQADREILSGYIAGFLGHYALDSYFHPYIYARTGFSVDKPKDKAYYGRHFALETALDVYYLKKWKKTTPEKFYQSKTIALSIREQAVITKMLANVISKVYQYPISKYSLNRAVNSMGLGTFLLHDRTGIKKSLMEKIERTFFGCLCLSPVIETTQDTDLSWVLNCRHDIWKNPWDDMGQSRSSVNEIMEAAAAYHHQLLIKLNNYLSGKTWKPLAYCIGNRSFHSGLESRKT